jgi:predicted GNAT family N-acyltransferase
MTHTFSVRPVADEEDLQAARSIRQAVFVQEQGCPEEEEWDAFDETSRHVLGFLVDRPIAAARFREVMLDAEPAAKLERFAVLQEFRGLGFGKQLVARVLEQARSAGYHCFVLHAQAHLERFYAACGFEATGERFFEVGIPHVKMMRREVPA